MNLSGHLPRGGRIREPADTVRGLAPHLRSFGITRLADQTGLDRIGIPVWAAMRPNSMSLAVNQGKGVDDDSAKASALMEAVEYAVAERPEVPAIVAAKDRLISGRAEVFYPRRSMPDGREIAADREISWIAGRRLLDDEPIWIPLEAARLDHTEVAFGGMSRSSNGLASGNDEDEALLHAACELVERDAATLFELKTERKALASGIDPSSFGNDMLNDLVDRIGQADLRLRLFDLTTDIGIPVVQALVWDAKSPLDLQFDVASGTGCHPIASHAAIRAVTEAAQTRVTNIAGARDDFDPSDYRKPLNRRLRAFVGQPQPSRGDPPTDCCLREGMPKDMLAVVRDRLEAAGILDVPYVVLGGRSRGVCVVKAFAPGLEDRPANRNWRPGPRAVAAISGLR